MSHYCTIKNSNTKIRAFHFFLDASAGPAQVQPKQKNQGLCILVEAQNMILFTFFILCASFCVLLKAGYCRRSTA